MNKRGIRTMPRVVSVATTSRAVGALVLATLLAGLVGCDNSDTTPLGSSNGEPTAPIEANVLRVADVTGKPIVGAVVTGIGEAATGQAITGNDGRASLADFPRGQLTIVVSAAGYEPVRYRMQLPFGGVHASSLNAVGAWAVGRAIVLGTRMVDVAADGSTLTFSADVAVIDPSATAIETLTSSDIEVLSIDCSWDGPRACASVAGKATGSGGFFAPDGPARSFGLQPPVARRPYRVGVLAERSKAVRNWDAQRTALKDYLTTLGGNDAASLALVETSGQSTTLSVLGPYTSDGRTYLDAIEGLADSGSEPPVMLDSILESIRRVAAANSDAQTNAEATVLVLATSSLTVADIDEATLLARQLGVRISAVVDYDFGWPEMAVRTGGFVAEYSDPRQLGLIFGAMDQLLAGTVPYYRMEFRVKGVAGTFVPGGNATVWLKIRVPSSLPNNGVVVMFDVVID